VIPPADLVFKYECVRRKRQSSSSRLAAPIMKITPGHEAAERSSSLPLLSDFGLDFIARYKSPPDVLL